MSLLPSEEPVSSSSFHNFGAEPARNPARTSRSTYVPPFLRNANSSTFAYPTTDSTRSAPRFSRVSLYDQSTLSQSPVRGEGGGRGRGRGRGRRRRRRRRRRGEGGGGGSGPGRGRGRSQRWPDSTTYTDPFEITDKFDELEVIEDEVDSDGNRAINFEAYEDIPVEATGSNVPPPVCSFAEIDLGEVLSENIKRCNYVKPTPIQKHAIPIAVAGRDLMACAQTGSGKTAAFCFPIICGILRSRFKNVGSVRCGPRVACPTALILSPTRELSCQIHEEAKKFAFNTGIKIVVAYGGAPIVHQFRNLEKGVDILVATPGRLVDMIERARVSLGSIKYLALDEADRMLDMGFEPQIRKIVQQMGMPPSGERQTLLFSATFPHEIQRLASEFLSNYIFLTVGRVGSSTDLIAQRVELVQDQDKRAHLMVLLHDQEENKGKHALTLVFVETKKGADALENWLSMHGFPAMAIHGDKVQMERERALKLFRSGATPILVATDVASRGLDIPRVSHVINFDLPKGIDDYVHRIGRTGRAGKTGLATAFFSEKNMPLAKSLVDLMKEANQDVPPWLAKYAENSSYGGSGSRGRRYGGSRFGDYDYRSDAQYGSESYYNSCEYHGASYDSPGTFDFPVSADADYYAGPSYGHGDAAPAIHDYQAASVTGSYLVAAHGYGFGLESVVATGWD